MRPLLDAETIAARVRELGRTIARDYAGRRPVFVGVLKGGFVFLADLVRQVELPLELDFVALSSYGQGTRPGELRLTGELSSDLRDRDVVIVDDICDTGRSLAALHEMLLGRGVRSLRTCVLLDKPARREVGLRLDYVGFSIPDRFVVGYGLDHAERHRNLPYVAVLGPEETAGPAGGGRCGDGSPGGGNGSAAGAGTAERAGAGT